MWYCKTNAWKIFVLVLEIVAVQGRMSKDKTTTVRSSSNNIYALLMIDVQYCFINGSLALSNSPAHQNGAEVIPVINNLIKKIPFNVFVYSMDWHPTNHISFFENLKSRQNYVLGDHYEKYKMFDTVIYTGPEAETKQVLWPTHCVQHTAEAKLDEDLTRFPAGNNVIYIKKGINPDIDSYSAFIDNDKIHKTPLDDELKARNVTHVFVAGLALDYCVGSTAIDAADLGYTTYVIKDACRGVDKKTMKAKLNELKQHNVEIIRSSQVKNVIRHSNRTKDATKTCPATEEVRNTRRSLNEKKRSHLKTNNCP